MCGIAGIWGEVNDGIVREMMKDQKHRGPDDEGLRTLTSQGSIGHVRLSIMDPERGHQPAVNETGDYTLVANGMIYNHPELRASLGDRHQYRSKSDSETTLHLFEELNRQTPASLDGAFALGVAHGERLFLARDPIGIKPLYYGRQSSRKGKQSPLYFASELKAISRWVDDVHEFPAGSWWDSEKGFQRYYHTPDLTPEDAPLDIHIQRLRSTLEKSIEKRLLSDVPLGAFLSGGLDSSIIAAVAKKKMGHLHTFSVGIEGSRDLEAARLVAKHIGTEHHEYAFCIDEVRRSLPEIVYYLESFDQDLVRSAIPCYFCSQLAKKDVTVILTGEGADELFAGYNYYKSMTDPEQLHQAMRLSIEGLHNVNLQRVDRMTMRHGIEGRVPFLDTEMIALAQTIPPKWKLYQEKDGSLTEKWILRKAVEDLLPEEIVWRVKEQFDEGSGTVDLLDQLIQEETHGIDSQAYMKRHQRDRLRSAEECYYHQILVDGCESPEPVLKNVGRWTGGMG